MDARDRAHPRTLVVPVRAAGIVMVPRTFRDLEGRRTLVGFTRVSKMIAVLGPQPVVRLTEPAIRRLIHGADLTLTLDPDAVADRPVIAEAG